jgi:hypothetical protein|tara:strand:- start:727 stop:1305 length:579 start_codon:yes stop_codon:yes gene_type:complete
MSQINTNFAQLLGDNVAQFEGAMELNALAQGSVKSTFDIQVKLSLKMHITYQWWKSAEGKQAMEYAGIVMTTEEFRDVWGYKKAFFSEMINLGKLRESESNKISEYKSETENRSVRGCLKFAKDGGADAESEEEGSESSTTLMTFSAKAEALDAEKGASLRLLSDGKIEGVTAQSIEALEMLLAKAKEQLNA